MRREELVELAKQHGIDLAQLPTELSDAHLEAVIGGMSKGGKKSGGSSSSGGGGGGGPRPGTLNIGT